MSWSRPRCGHQPEHPCRTPSTRLRLILPVPAVHSRATASCSPLCSCLNVRTCLNVRNAETPALPRSPARPDWSKAISRPWRGRRPGAARVGPARPRHLHRGGHACWSSSELPFRRRGDRLPQGRRRHAWCVVLDDGRPGGRMFSRRGSVRPVEPPGGGSCPRSVDQGEGARRIDDLARTVTTRRPGGTVGERTQVITKLRASCSPRPTGRDRLHRRPRRPPRRGSSKCGRRDQPPPHHLDEVERRPVVVSGVRFLAVVGMRRQSVGEPSLFAA